MSAGAHTASGLSVGAAAREAGDRLALVAGRRRWSWSEVHEAVVRERERLPLEEARRAGHHRIALDAHPTAETVIRLLALIDAEICAVPLPPGLPPAIRASRLRLVAPCLDLEAGRAAAASGETAASGEAAASGATAERVDGGSLRWQTRPVRRAHGEEGLRGGGSSDDVGEPGAAPLALLFTSGTSGQPRAVELSRSAFGAAAAASAAHLGWDEDDRWLCCLPLAHVGGLSIITRCLLARRAVVLARGFDAADVLRLLDREAVTLASFVPTMLHRLFEVEADWKAPGTLRAALVGGAPAGEKLWAELERRGVPALATYGMTETCAQVATGRLDAPRRLVPLEGVRLRISAGRIEIAGPMLCSRVGLARNGERSPWTADGFLRTGDMGDLRAGSLEIRGRADDLIITGGENVAPAEVEAVLVTHPAIRRAVVFGTPDEEWGEVVAAVLELEKPGCRPSDGELRSWLAQRLPAFARPRRVAWLRRLPETPLGKPDRSAAAGQARRSAEPI